MQIRKMTKHASSICILILALCSIRASSTVSEFWTQSNDNLADYDLLTTDTLKSMVHCTALVTQLSDVQLLTYNSSTGVCSAYRCRLSLKDCRKCRNIDSNNQIVWIPSSIAGACWITVQHRVSNSTNFYRNWSDYKAGFGEGPKGNFWIGLDSIYSLTSVSGGRKLRFLIKAWNSSESWAQYSSFSVGAESDGFRLNVSGFSSSHPAIGDSFGITNGSKFSTIDRENDVYVGRCAVQFIGAWWFKACFDAHANGPYQNYPTAINAPYAVGIIWNAGYGYYYSLMEIEMLIS